MSLLDNSSTTIDSILTVKKRNQNKNNEISLQEERILKLNVKKIGELIDEEMEDKYQGDLERLIEQKIMIKALKHGKNFQMMEQLWRDGELSDLSCDSTLPSAKVKSKSVKHTARKELATDTKSITEKPLTNNNASINNSAAKDLLEMKISRIKKK